MSSEADSSGRCTQKARRILSVLQVVFPLIALAVLSHRASDLARPLDIDDEPVVTASLGVSALSIVAFAGHTLLARWRRAIVVFLAMAVYLPIIGVAQDQYLVNLASVVKSFDGVTAYAIDVWFKMLVVFAAASLHRIAYFGLRSWRAGRRSDSDSASSSNPS